MNIQQYELLKKSVQEFNQWRSEHPEEKIDLRGAYLSGAILKYANLRETDLSFADLRRADLSGAYLRGADLRGADLREANLSKANLWRTDLREANFMEATILKCHFPSLTMVLLASWGECSDELTLQLMRLEASCHPDPTIFDRWASNDGSCLYDGCSFQRAANFKEKKELWKAGSPEKVINIVNMLLKEKCKGWE